jgi:hypothetical protein
MAKKADQQMIVKPSADGLAKAAARGAGKGPPPVHLWNPPFCGEIDMEIRRNGTWFYMGTPIGRPALVKLFSGILWREGDAYFLVTPVEKVGIQVEDAPFVAVDVTAVEDGTGQRLRFTTNVDEVVEAGPDHPIRVVHDGVTGEPSPYVLVRRNLEALIDRKTFYRMVDLGSVGRHAGAEWFGVWSGGVFFPIIPSAQLA